MKGTPKQIRWAESIRKNRIAVWSQSEFFKEIEAEIIAIYDSTWWIANKDQTFEAIYNKKKADAMARADMETWTRIDTGTGSRWISPTRDIATGEVVDGDSLPF